MIKRILAGVTAAAALVAVSGSVVDAAGPDRGEYDTAWTVLAANCDQIPAGTVLTGSGQGHFTNNVRTNGAGVTIVRGVAHAQGTATDQDGNAYTWVYTNGVVGEIVDGVLYARMVDSFVVTGSGPAAYVTGFSADIVEEFGVSFDITARHVLGDPFDFVNDSGRCDPI
jgi:hypothetical protein